MNNYCNKICKELLKVVELKKSGELSSCIIYANSYNKLKEKVKSLNTTYYEYPFIKAIGVSLNQNQIIQFAKTSIVGFISKQTKVSTQVHIAKKILNTLSLEKQVKDNKFSIAIIDTGINPHIDFCIPSYRIIKFIDLINNKEHPYDDNGHGTYVASIACGNGIASAKKYSGIASKANIVSIKALESNGEAGAYKILEAMQWISDNYKKYNIKVVCMSFGSNPLGKNDPLILGAETLWSMGIIVVAAAGTSGPENYTIKAPGFSSRIITVGGLDDNRNENDEYDFKNFKVANFSSRGPAGRFFKPDLIAPAVNIIGATFNTKTREFYAKMSGTSVATPMIAGICYLMLEKEPNLSPDQVKLKLIRNCKSLTKNRNEEGFGILTLKN